MGRLSIGHIGGGRLKVMLLIVGGVAAALLLDTGNADAIPVFARKYGTSCQTCHVAFPELTPFGEAFKRNGYRFPGDTEESASKDEPSPLGSEAYKKLWPKEVWPGVIPGKIPIAVMISSQYNYTPQDKYYGMDENHSFEDFGASFELISAGTLGPHISFWGGAAIEGEEASVERTFAQFNFFSTPLLNLKVGSFEPGLTETSMHRLPMEDIWFTLRPVGDNEWSPEELQQGFELNGNVAGRVGYNVGLVEGSGNFQNRDKDAYGRIEVKLGGMRLDGVTEANNSNATPKPWTDNGITISAFYYEGSALLGDTVGVQNDNFHRWGADLAGSLGNLLYRGGWFTQHNQQPVLGALGQDVDTSAWFAQTEYVVYPWLIPMARYENWKTDLQHDPDQRVMYGLITLVRANIRVLVYSDMMAIDGGPLKTANVAANLTMVW